MALMADYIDRGLDPMDIGDDSHMPYRVEVTDDGHADILWREELRFHRELCEADHARYPDNPSFRPWSDYAQGGWLKAESVEKLVTELRKLTGVR